MSFKSLRRLAADHAALHSELPPNYLFPANSDSDDLTHLDILLAGPEGTPYAAGVFKLHLEIPKTYPAAPPTAHFRTRIWHPNVEEATGAVCVDTLKRDWQSTLTLKDILITISCLLIQPNPASALNAEAGALLQDDWEAFFKRAKLMVSIHAQIPRDLKQSVDKAKARGEEKPPEKEKEVDRAMERPKGKSKMNEGIGSVTRASARKAKVIATGKTLAEQEENWGARRESEDWIPAPTISTSTQGLYGTAMGPPSTESLGLDSSGAQLPNTPLNGNSQATASAPRSPPVRALRRSHLKLQSSYQTPQPQRSQQSSASPQHSIASSSSNGSLNTRLNTLSFGWSPDKATKEKLSPDAERRVRHESRRFKAAGYCLKRYNRGAFGPRQGLKRL
ncbi:ubiquitin-conjugating enzyme/RWD-like protein [Phyllosticta citriasiana]|uniref:ubiquitin-conjugating enzyme/RWD-like protein n=1 Tax=Phyllosticta citriasiana TaxID=595635 RepID=UPI0030FD66BB